MKTIILALTSLAALAVIGCNRDQAAPASTTGAPSAGLTTGKTLRIVFIPKNSGNPYFNEVDRGFSEAAKDFGFNYTTAAPATADATSQIPIIKEQVQRGVDVIAIAVNSPDALNPALDEARSRGITIITVDADLVGNEAHRDAAILPTNFDEIGTSQVEIRPLSHTGHQCYIHYL
jgi:rhamnose transport system substrate-binding protein